MFPGPSLCRLFLTSGSESKTSILLGLFPGLYSFCVQFILPSNSLLQVQQEANEITSITGQLVSHTHAFLN